jgi:protein-tyrosine phosphatase
MNFDRVLDHVYVGSYPESVADVDRLKQELGITAVLSLQTDEDADRFGVDWPWFQTHYHQAAIELRRVPVRDFDPHDLQEKLPACVEVLRGLLQAGHTVYVHCTAGAGRSPNVVIAYLHWVQRWDLDEAVDHVCHRRACSPDPDLIRWAGKELHRDLRSAGQD